MHFFNKTILIMGLVILIGRVLLDNPVLAQDTEGINVKVGIMPFSPVGVDEESAEKIARIIGTKLSAAASVIDHDNIMDELEDEDCDDKEDWDNKECVQEIGDELEADYMLAGSIGKVGTLFILQANLYAVEKNTPVWSQEYKIEGTIDNVLISVPQKIADECISALTAAVGDASEPVQTQSGGVPEGRDLPPSDNGIVKGATIGFHGLFSVGEVEKNQSPAGFFGMFLYPTTENSHIRIKAGVPLFHNRVNPLTEDKKRPDVRISVEHEWGFRKFGVTAGLAYTVLMPFEGIYTDEHRWDDDEHYLCSFDTYHSFNFVVGIRGGRPTGAFYGRISFPLAIAFEEGRGDYIFEYSLFGVFGAKHTKVGIGNMGMFKHREPSEVIDTNGIAVSNTVYDNNFGLSDATEFYSVIPCLKVAHLFGERIVVNFTMELGGIIIPRFADMTWWRPSLGCDFVFSFGKLDGPNVMDGTF